MMQTSLVFVMYIFPDTWKFMWHVHRMQETCIFPFFPSAAICRCMDFPMFAAVRNSSCVNIVETSVCAVLGLPTFTCTGSQLSTLLSSFPNAESWSLYWHTCKVILTHFLLCSMMTLEANLQGFAAYLKFRTYMQDYINDIHYKFGSSKNYWFHQWWKTLAAFPTSYTIIPTLLLAVPHSIKTDRCHGKAWYETRGNTSFLYEMSGETVTGLQSAARIWTCLHALKILSCLPFRLDIMYTHLWKMTASGCGSCHDMFHYKQVHLRASMNGASTMKCCRQHLYTVYTTGYFGWWV